MARKLLAALVLVSLGMVGCSSHRQPRPDSLWARSASVSLIPPIAVEADYDQRGFDLELALRSLAARDASLARSGRPRATAASRGAKRSRIAAPVGDEWYWCSRRVEHGGSYSRSSNPSHFGLLQWSKGAWAKYGGDPATWGTASPEEQERVAETARTTPGAWRDWTPFNPC